MEDGELIPRSFHLCPRHYTFLEHVNKDSRSQALRTVLDSIISGQEQTYRKKILDNSIMWACFGSIFLFISYIIPVEAQFFAVGIGIFLFSYGTIGGVINAIQRTRHH